MHSVVRVLAVAGLAAVSFTCADRNVSGLGSKLAFLPIAPAWIQAPDGGPDIEIERVRGVLRTSSGLDSAVAEATVEGDSAVLEFLRVSVSGDSTSYGLSIQAFDSNDVVVFSANDTISVLPGENPPATPEMQYTAPDAVATQVEIQIGGASATTTTLDWAGAKPGDLSCLHRDTTGTRVTTRQLTAIGRTATNTEVPNLRVGWTSLNENVATVDDNGLLRSRCSNLSTKVVAKSFLDRSDTITVNVVAPPFTLLMNPETVTLPRGSIDTLVAVTIDENGNQSPAGNVQYHSSDPSKATVGLTSGIVTALRNGRVQITATAGERTTVGIVDVVRPQAASVKVLPVRDTLGFGQIRQFVARALDAAGNVIGDAVDFQWTSSNTGVATVVAATGVASAKTQAGSSTLTATIDGKSGTSALQVVTNLPPGTLSGIIRDGATDAVVAGATVGIIGGASVATDAGGRFTLGGIAAGDSLQISKTGYTNIRLYNAPAFPNTTIFIDDIPFPPASGATGSMTGKVINAITGTGVSGITVTAYADVNSAPSPIRPNPTVIATTTTASNGTFTFAGRAAGAYTLIASGTGYSSGIGVGVVVGGTTKTMGDIILPPTAPNPSSIYMVLTWGPAGQHVNMPADLDLYVTGPAPTSSTDTVTRFQVHSGNRARLVGLDTIAMIDIADNTGPGPEVGSLRSSATPGLYRIYVRNISHASQTGRLSLADSSDVRLDVFQGNRVIATFLPPAGKVGTVWEVFRFDGARILPTDANTSVTESAAGSTLPIMVEPPAKPSTKPAIPLKRR
jgi:hypothetical protein